jgi:hypothetical protein
MAAADEAEFWLRECIDAMSLNNFAENAVSIPGDTVTVLHQVCSQGPSDRPRFAADRSLTLPGRAGKCEA